MILVALKTITVAGKDPEGLNAWSPVLQRSYARERYREGYAAERVNVVNPAGWHPQNVSVAPGQTFDTAASGISDAEANDLIANGSARLAPRS